MYNHRAEDIQDTIERATCCFVKNAFATASKQSRTIKRSKLYSEHEEHLKLSMMVDAISQPSFRERLGAEDLSLIIDYINLNCDC